MTIDAWPSDIPCGAPDFTLTGGAMSAGANGLLPLAIGSTFGGPHWLATIAGLPLRTPAQIAAARALEGVLDGGATPIMLPVCVGPLSPAVAGSPAMACDITADAVAGATTLHLAFAGTRQPLRGGELFNVDDDDAGKRLHMVMEVTGGTSAAPVVRIAPPLRAALSNGDPVYFDDLVCPMRLADGFDLTLSMGRFAQIDATFEEWFEPAVVLALRNLSLSPHTIESGSAEDTFVGFLLGTTSGSVLILTNSAGSKFKLVDNGGGVWSIVAGSVATDYSSAHSHSITVRETLTGYVGSPKDNALTVNVTIPIPTEMELAFENPGFETGDMTGWTVSDPSVVAYSATVNFAGDDLPRSGTWAARGGTVSTSRMWQDFDVSAFAPRIDTGHVTLEGFQAYNATYDPQPDGGQLEVTFYDEDGDTVGAASFLAHPAPGWSLAALPARGVPVGTRTIRLGVANFRLSGVNNDSYWDDFPGAGGGMKLKYTP